MDRILPKLSTAGFVNTVILHTKSGNLVNGNTLFTSIQLSDMELYFGAMQLIVVRFSNCEKG
jgi:hypothetical protein